MENNRFEGAHPNDAVNKHGGARTMMASAKAEGEDAASKFADQAHHTFDAAKDKAGEMADAVSEELASLRAKVESLLNDKVTPALANAAEAAQGYVHGAKDAVAGQVDNAASTIKDRPVTAMLVVAALGYLLGRLTAPPPVRRRW